MNPFDRLIADRQLARNQEDTGADTGSLALTEDGQPSVRTLVLRDITQSGITLFINKSSPKWRTIEKNPHAELLIWFHSVQRQYRVAGRIKMLDPAIIQENWHRRPSASKYIDWVYEKEIQQSAKIGSRQALINTVNQLKTDTPESSLTPPKGAAGILLMANRVEILDLKSPDRIHERKLYELKANQWVTSQLMP